jgi:hypothetical protein
MQNADIGLPSPWYYVLEFGAPIAWAAWLFITAMNDPKGRGWHDRAAGSVVVRRAGSPS